MNRKYLVNGEEVEVIQKLKRGFLVAYIMENDESEYVDKGNLFVAEVLFNATPTTKQDTIISELKNEIVQLQEDKVKLMDSITSVEAENAERLKKYKQYKQLENIDDFLNGKITHYVCLSWNLKIVCREDDTCEYDKGNTKLLTLFGKSNGGLQWRLNDYSDGSGSNEHVVPCTSYEEALTIMQSHIKHRTETDGQPDKRVIKAAEIYDLEIDGEYVDMYKAIMLKAHEEDIQTKKADIRTTRAKIKNLIK